VASDELWRPDDERRRTCRLTAFAAYAATKSTIPYDQSRATYADLYRWSVADPARFWQLLSDFMATRWTARPTSAFVPPQAGRMRGGRFFAEGTLNYAEHLLGTPTTGPALIAHAEGGERRTIEHAALRAAVARCAAGLKAAGVRQGDRVAGVMANVPEALIAMAATAQLGAIWSSCSPDFGAAAIADRLGQVEPKVLFHTTTYVYGAKRHDATATIAAALERLPTVRVVVPVDHLGGAAAFQAFGADRPPETEFVPVAFDAPLFIMFSSGTTGVPKCIVHGVGGTLLQHQKELALHCDLRSGDRLLYYTTCGWMMWNWMASSLSLGATLVLYDGAVNQPDMAALWRIIAEDGVTHFGTSPKFISACMAAGVRPAPLVATAPLRTVLSTGAPLMPEQFAWVYQSVKRDVHLASISGGTDIISCFMLGNPWSPVYAGEIQGAGLGMAIDAWDEAGNPVRGEKGELVCTQPFPSMPVGFWNDPDGKKYTAAYFDHYDGRSREVWRHGDYVEITPTGGVIVYGRSDATLNPGGVRIGTAELYRQVETLPEVLDAIAIGRRDDQGDTTITLFVKLKTGVALDAALTDKIKTTIRRNLTPRHVPKEVIAVRDIPYTRSGKKVEMAVTQAVHGEPVPNLAALANPESMDEFFAMAPSS
jgi:acetoacetyl-CoA synthetase